VTALEPKADINGASWTWFRVLSLIRKSCSGAHDFAMHWVRLGLRTIGLIVFVGWFPIRLCVSCLTRRSSQSSPRDASFWPFGRLASLLLVGYLVVALTTSVLIAVLSHARFLSPDNRGDTLDAQGANSGSGQPGSGGADTIKHGLAGFSTDRAAEAAKSTSSANSTRTPRTAENGDVRGRDNDGDGQAESVYVRGYTRKDGVRIEGHYRKK